MFPDEPHEASRNAQARKEAPRLTGHDAVLNAIRKDGREIRVAKSDGSQVIGRLVAFDKYSLSVDDGSVTRVVFKHAIDEFSAAQRKH